jgi:hypothetical protein
MIDEIGLGCVRQTLGYVFFQMRQRCSEEDVRWVGVIGVLVHSASNCKWTSILHENADDRGVGRLYSLGPRPPKPEDGIWGSHAPGFEIGSGGPSVGPCLLRGWTLASTQFELPQTTTWTFLGA